MELGVCIVVFISYSLQFVSMSQNLEDIEACSRAAKLQTLEEIICMPTLEWDS